MVLDLSSGKDVVSISIVNAQGEVVSVEKLSEVSLSVVKDKAIAPIGGIDFSKGCSGKLNLVHDTDFFNVFREPFNYIEFMTGYEEKVLKPYLKHKRRERNRKKLHDKKPKRRKVRR